MKKPITIVSSISFLLFLIALIWFGAGIYTDKKNGSAKSDQRFSTLLNETKQNFQTNQYGTREFSNNFIRSIGNIDDFSSLKLEINGELVYSYPPHTFTLPSPDLVKSYSETIYTDESSFTLKASIYLMKPGSVYNHSRFAFVLILFGTVMAGIFILLLNGAESASSYSFKTKRRGYKSFSDYVKSDSEKSEKPFAFKEESKKSDEISEDEETQDSDESEKSDSQEQQEQKSEESENESNIIEDSEAAQENAPAAKEPIFNPELAQTEQKEQASEEINIQFPESEPFFDSEDEDGLDIIDQMEQENEMASIFDDETDESDSLDFEETPEIHFDEPETQEDSSIKETVQVQAAAVSPVTSLLLQNSLEEQFDKIIQSGKTHATISLVKINGLDRGNAISQKVISILRDETKNAPIFEYKADAYAIVLSESDLQATVDTFEQIYNKIEDFLKSNNAANEVSVGISSASGRTVKAERVILEASQALDYASQDPDSPIVAFRVKA